MGRVLGFACINGVPPACPTVAEDAFPRNIDTRHPPGLRSPGCQRSFLSGYRFAKPFTLPDR